MKGWLFKENYSFMCGRLPLFKEKCDCGSERANIIKGYSRN